MTSYCPGTRLSFNNILCTVRYVGPLPEQKGDWLGVEWDDPERGKHDGQYKGKRLFETLSPSSSCASFIRATRPADKPRSFLQALRYKYAEDDGSQQSAGEVEGSIEISGKMVEEVGFERIRQQQAVLHTLKVVVLDGLRISGIGAEAEVESVQREIATTCPDIVELDLSRNLFEHWKDIVDICAALRKLRVLKASGLRLATFHPVVSYPLWEVRELHLNDCLLTPDQILGMLCKRMEEDAVEVLFPSLSSLSVAANNLSSFNPSTPGQVRHLFVTVKTLVMDMNAFTSLIPLCLSLMTLFPNLTTLSLQNNNISALDSEVPTPEQPLSAFSSITTLNLSNNAITTYTLISSLTQIFPNLTSLRVSGNPVFLPPANSAHRIDAAFMLTVARLSTLTTLNYSTITDKDRMEAELYYLSEAEKDLQRREALASREDSIGALERDWPRYHELCGKYDREDLVEKLVAAAAAAAALDAGAPSGPAPATASRPAIRPRKTYPHNTLGARLVSITFQLHPPSPTTGGPQETTTLLLPRTLDVYRVKSLLVRKVGRQWDLRPLGFGFEIVRIRDAGAGAAGAAGQAGKGEEVEAIPDSTRKIGDWINDDDDGGGEGMLVRVHREP